MNIKQFILPLLICTSVHAESGYIGVSDKEGLECLALNIYHEARGEEEYGRDMVAAVTLNRVLDSKFPSSICEVVWQSKQFSWTSDGKSDIPKDKPAYIDAINRANQIIFNYMINEADTMDNALYYHADHILPEWNYNKLSNLYQIGKHIVYADAS